MVLSLRNRTTLVWLVLIAATVSSWVLGVDVISPAGNSTVSIVILAVALFKVRLIGLHFMELRESPLPLRGLFEAYCLILWATLAGTFLFA